MTVSFLSLGVFSVYHCNSLAPSGGYEYIFSSLSKKNKEERRNSTIDVTIPVRI